MNRPTALLLFCLACTCGLAPCLLAQGDAPTLLRLNGATLDHQQTAMKLLGGYALVNIAGGLALRAGSTGSARYFYEMNALWNTVNLGIAGFGYLASLKADPAAWTLTEGLRENQQFAKILLFNAGLDVGYLMGGLYLRERARRPEANGERLTGFGNAILLQGGFLLVFDLVNYFVANGRGRELELLIGPVGEGLGLRLQF